MQNSKPRFNLTPKQKEVFDFVKKYIDENEYAPSHNEIKEALNFKAQSNVAGLLEGLKERNWIDFIKHKSRSITIINEGE